MHFRPGHFGRWCVPWGLGVALLTVVVPALALDPGKSIFQYNYQTWRRANGLPANTIYAIAQAKDGRMWLGTGKGLVYFDGIEFHVEELPPDMPIEGSAISSLYPRSAGGVWFGAEQEGIGFFDGRKFVALEVPGIRNRMLRIVRETPEGALEYGAAGVAGRLVGNTNFISMLPKENADVLCVFEDSAGRTWMGTADGGLFYWKDGQVHEFPDQTLRGLIISAVVVDAEGRIWVGAPDENGRGIRCYDADFRRIPLDVTFAPAKALLLDRTGTLWIGTSGDGLVRCRDGKFEFFRRQDGLANDRVLSLAESEDGSLWVGTVDGLSQLSDVKFPILSVPEGLVSDACLSVAPSPSGGIWAGTPNGVSHYSDGHFTNYGLNGGDGFTSRWIKRVFVAHNGDVYFMGARKNIDRFRGGQVIASWTNNVWPRAMAEDSKGILVALADDLMRLENNQLVPFRLANGDSVSAQWINDLLVTTDDSVWIAANDGVKRVKSGRLETVSDPNKQAAFLVLCQDENGDVWGSQSAGLTRFKNGAMQVVGRDHGLHENLVRAIVPDQFGDFWCDSSRGIFRVNERELNAVADGTAQRVHCTVYDGEEAVKTTDKLDGEYSGCRSLDGRIWFSSSKGVICIDPAHIVLDSRPPPLFLERVRVNGRVYRADEVPKIQPGSGNLEFSYAALDYQAPHKIQYRYRLEGYQSEWVNAGTRRRAFYTNLKPGRYRFEVQACNSDGIWTTNGAALALTLPPRFHETPVFKAAMLAAIGGLVVYFWWFWNLRRKQVQLQQANALMESRVRERTAELAAANTALRSEMEQRELAQAKSEELQEQLLVASRQAGQAEVASSVLHNVGNVLNSVNISSSLLAERLRSLRADSLTKAADLMNGNGENLRQYLTQDPRGQKLPNYLKQLADHLRNERDQMMAELKNLAENVEHIKEIVAMQQSYAKVSGVMEKAVISDLVDAALRMHAGSYQRHGIAVVREYVPVPEMVLDKHKTLQILINVMRNAKYACDESNRLDKKVTVRVGPQRQDRVSVSIEDNGIGIAPENITRIFSHGFTTRKDGHGFGLHSAALAAREMGGALTAASEGPGRGAVFTLELPLSPGIGIDQPPGFQPSTASTLLVPN